MKVFSYKEVPEKPFLEEGAKGVYVRWLIGEELAENFYMRLFRIDPGGYSPLHSHPWEHEVFILEGECLVVCGEEEKLVKSGDAIFIPPNEKHQFKNIGSIPVRFLCLIPAKGLVKEKRKT